MRTSHLLFPTIVGIIAMRRKKKKKKIDSPIEIFDRVFMINLRSRTDRRAFMDHKLRFVFDRYETIEAVDGRRDALDDTHGRGLSMGERGLIQTWRNLLMRLVEVEDFHGRVLVLEDDAYFIKDFSKRLDEHRDAFETHDVVYLGANEQRRVSFDRLEASHFTIPRHFSHVYGTYAISLNTKAIRTLYDSIVRAPIDNHIFDFIRSGRLSGCVLHPNLVIPELRDSDLRSSRSMERQARHMRWHLEDYEHLDKYDAFIAKYDPSISVCIPCVVSHVQYLNGVLDNLQEQTLQPSEVVISVSEISNRELKKLRLEIANRYDPFPVVVIGTRAIAFAGANRNACARTAQSELLLFTDADDDMHLRKLEIVRDTFRKTRFDALLHHYATAKSKVLRRRRRRKSSLAKAVRASCVKSTGHIVRHGRVNHGHISIRRDVYMQTMQDETLRRGEDGEFIRRLANDKRRLFCLPVPLVRYNFERTSAPEANELLRSKVSRLTRTFLRFLGS